jgi:hypothetical protein
MKHFNQLLEKSDKKHNHNDPCRIVNSPEEYKSGRSLASASTGDRAIEIDCVTPYDSQKYRIKVVKNLEKDLYFLTSTLGNY